MMISSLQTHPHSILSHLNLFLILIHYRRKINSYHSKSLGFKIIVSIVIYSFLEYFAYRNHNYRITLQFPHLLVKLDQELYSIII